MIQLTYISSAVRGVSEPAVRDILKASRNNNAAVGVTGLLLYNGRRFLQALEGDEPSVLATYERIKVDPRHRAVVLLSSRRIERRIFGSWAMAAQQVSSSIDSEELARQVEVLTADIADADIRSHFRSFAQLKPAA